MKIGFEVSGAKKGAGSRGGISRYVTEPSIVPIVTCTEIRLASPPILARPIMLRERHSAALLHFAQLDTKFEDSSNLGHSLRLISGQSPANIRPYIFSKFRESSQLNLVPIPARILVFQCTIIRMLVTISEHY
jgi:hypothetical protein